MTCNIYNIKKIFQIDAQPHVRTWAKTGIQLAYIWHSNMCQRVGMAS
jgi:hypothetical protein